MICLYSFLDGKEEHLDRLLASILLSTQKPERVIFLTKNKFLLDNFTYLFWKQKLEKHYNIMCDLIPHHVSLTLEQQNKLVHRLMQSGAYDHGLYVHEQAVLERDAISAMLAEFELEPLTTEVTTQIIWPDASWCLLEPRSVCRMVSVQAKDVPRTVQLDEIYTTFYPINSNRVSAREIEEQEQRLATHDAG